MFNPKNNEVTIERALAWNAAMVGLVWACLAIVGGAILGVSTYYEGLVVKKSSFLIYALGMIMLFCRVNGRLRQSSELGMLSFTVSRFSWMLVGTVAWAALTAAPVGVYHDLFAALTNLKKLDPSAQTYVLGSLMVGQSFLVAAGLAWVLLVLSFFNARARSNPKVPATLVSLMVFFAGVALGCGFHAFGQLLAAAPDL